MTVSHWLFQANPKYSRILQALRDRAQVHWLITRYVDRVASGDSVLIWIAGKQAGIYATAQVLTPPQFLAEPPDIDIWLMPERAWGRHYAPVQLIRKLTETPVLKATLQQHSATRHLEVIRFPRNTNFHLTEAEWRSLNRFLPPE